MSTLNIALLFGLIFWSALGWGLWVIVDIQLMSYHKNPPKTWKLVIFTCLCGPLPLFIILLSGIGKILEKRINNLIEWITT